MRFQAGRRRGPARLLAQPRTPLVPHDPRSYDRRNDGMGSKGGAMRSAVVGFVLMVLSSFFFAVSGPIAKSLFASGWTPGSTVLVRMAGGGLILLVPTLWALRGRWIRVRLTWRTVLAYGIFSMAGVQVFFFLSLGLLSVAIALLIIMLGAPLIIVALIWVRTRRRPPAVTFAGIGASLAGMVLILGPSTGEFSWAGLVAALVSSCCFASYFFIAEREQIELPPIGFTGLGMWIGLAALSLALAIGVLPAGTSAADVDLAGTRVSWVVPIGLLILFTVGAYWTGILGIRRLGAPVSSFVNLVEVPFSAIAAWVLLAEALTGLQLVGGLIIIVGVVLIKWGDAGTGVIGGSVSGG